MATGWAGGDTGYTFPGVPPPAGRSDHLPRSVRLPLKRYYQSTLLWVSEDRRSPAEVVAAQTAEVSSRTGRPFAAPEPGALTGRKVWSPSLRTRRGHFRELGRRCRVCLLLATGEVFRFGHLAST